MIVTFDANNVDMALAVQSEIYNGMQDAIDSGEIEGVEFFTTEEPMVKCKRPPEGVDPFPPEVKA
jgi:hypothetical protein